MFAVWAGHRDFFVMATSVTKKLEAVGVESERKKTVWAECLPTTITTNSERGRTTAIVKDEGLEFLLETVFDRLDELVANKAMASEALAVLKVYELDIATSFTFDGEFV